MKKKIISFSILVIMLMLVAMLAATSAASACSINQRCNIVPASQKTGAVISKAPGEVTTLKNGIVLDNGIIYDATGKLTIGSTTYNIYSANTIDAVYNPKTEVLNDRFDAVWYVGTGTTVSSDGFKGDIYVQYTAVTSFPPTVTNLAVSQLTVHCVLRGFGSFAGQTLVLSYDQPTSVTTASWTGFVVAH
jgi:hypothetical protein